MEVQGQKNNKQVIANLVCIYVGDLIPYIAIFFITVMAGHLYGAAQANEFNLAYSYSAMALSLFAVPGMLPLKRSLAQAKIFGSILHAALIIRFSGLLVGGVVCFIYFFSSPHLVPLLMVFCLVFFARVFETSVDIPAAFVQYRWRPISYFLFRLGMLLGLVLLLIAFQYVLTGFKELLLGYVAAASLIAIAALVCIRPQLRVEGSIWFEVKRQLLEIRPIFLAICVYVASTRLYVVIIGEHLGARQAAEFATVQNITAISGLLVSAFAGLFFWERSRLPSASVQLHADSLWNWGTCAILSGGLLGVGVALATERIVLMPLQMESEMFNVTWIICMTTPLLALQALASNFLVLIKRDRSMLELSIFSSITGLLVQLVLIPSYGLLGAAVSFIAAPLCSILGSIFLIRRALLHAYTAGT